MTTVYRTRKFSSGMRTARLPTRGGQELVEGVPVQRSGEGGSLSQGQEFPVQ